MKVAIYSMLIRFDCILYNPPPIKSNGIYFAFFSYIAIVNCMVFEKVLVFFLQGG